MALEIAVSTLDLLSGVGATLTVEFNGTLEDVQEELKRGDPDLVHVADLLTPVLVVRFQGRNGLSVVKAVEDKLVFKCIQGTGFTKFLIGYCEVTGIDYSINK